MGTSPICGRPGESGNPSGRSKAEYKVSDFAKQFTEGAIRTLVEIFEDPKAPPSARVRAATAVLDRAWGRAPVSIEAKADAVDLNAMHLAALEALVSGTAATLVEGELVDVTPDGPTRPAID